MLLTRWRRPAAGEPLRGDAGQAPPEAGDELAPFLARCRELGLADIDLDDLVYDAIAREAASSPSARAGGEAAEVVRWTDGSHEREASRINNRGIQAQLRFLLEKLGPEPLVAELDALADFE